MLILFAQQENKTYGTEEREWILKVTLRTDSMI